MKALPEHCRGPKKPSCRPHADGSPRNRCRGPLHAQASQHRLEPAGSVERSRPHRLRGMSPSTRPPSPWRTLGLGPDAALAKTPLPGPACANTYVTVAAGPRPGQVLHSGRRAPNGGSAGSMLTFGAQRRTGTVADGHTWPANQVPPAARRSLGGFGQPSTKRPGAWECGPPGTGERLLGPATLGEAGIKARARVAGQNQIDARRPYALGNTGPYSLPYTAPPRSLTLRRAAPMASARRAPGGLCAESGNGQHRPLGHG